jgi:hypothetical protein
MDQVLGRYLRSTAMHELVELAGDADERGNRDARHDSAGVACQHLHFALEGGCQRLGERREQNTRMFAASS